MSDINPTDLKLAGVWRSNIEFPNESGKYIVRDKYNVGEVKCSVVRTAKVWRESNFDEWLDESPAALKEIEDYFRRKFETEKCPNCKGRGELCYEPDCDGECPDCHGTGKTEKRADHKTNKPMGHDESIFGFGKDW